MNKMSTGNNTFTIYFEVNISNIDKICRNTPLKKKFWGYDQGLYQNQYGNAIGFAPGYNMGNPSSTAKWQGDTLKCPMSVDSAYPTNNPNIFNLCYDGTVSSVDTSLEKYPIVGYRNNQNYEFNERSGTLPLTSFSIPKNSFNRGWIDVTGTDNILYKCPTCENNGNDSSSANKGNPEQTYMYSNGKMKSGSQFEYTDLVGKSAEKTVNCNCYGDECEYWFPPRDSGFSPQGWTYDGLAGCIWFNQDSDAGSGYQHIRSLTNICMTGEPTFTYNTYTPIPYNIAPTITNGTYEPPKNLINYGYYNYGIFSNPLLSIILSLNPGPSSSVTTDSSNPTCTQQFNYDLKNIPSSFAVFSVTYNISNSDFIESSFPNQMLDLFYFYESLSNTFTDTFKNSCYYNDTKTALYQMSIDYCSKSSNMSLSLCSSDFLPFSFLNQSPCIDNITYCKEGLLNFCSKPSNYNSEQCLTYYSQSYDGTQLDTDTQVMLQGTCGDIYNSTEDKSSLGEDFWTVCGCYLPQDVYSQYLEENNMSNSILGYQQCWYLPCITSSVLPSTNPECPSNEITNCIQYKYITVDDTETSQTKQDVTKSSLNNCSGVNYNFETTNAPITENFTLLQTQKNKKVNIIFIVLICIFILMILIKKFFI